MVKFPNLGKNFFLFIQNWQCCPHLQHLGKYRYFTRSSSSEKDCSSSSNSEGTWGFPASLITPFFFCIFILEEIRVRSSFVGISPGFQLPKGIEVSIKMCIYTWWTHQKQGGSSLCMVTSIITLQSVILQLPISEQLDQWGLAQFCFGGFLLSFAASLTDLSF